MKIQNLWQDNRSELRLIIPDTAWNTLQGYVKATSGEISGFFDVEYDMELKALKVGTIYPLLDQVASGADVEISEDAIQSFMLDHIKAGHDQMPRGWWHSHANLEVFFSGTDENTINKLNNDSYIVALVVNKTEHAYSKVSFIKPFPVQVEDLTIEIDGLSADLPDVSEDVKSKVKVRQYKNYSLYDPKTKSYNYGTSDKKKGFSKMLPKSKLEALVKIETLQLERVWDNTTSQFTYQDPLTYELWYDYWGCVTYADYKSLNLYPITGKTDDLGNRWDY